MQNRITRFNCFLIVSPWSDLAREKTKKLALDFGVNLEKISPDVTFIRPPRKEITIDQIRDLKSQIFQKPVEHKYKFVIIENAHYITHEGQNSLLKLLEEPPAHAVIVLESKNKTQLLPTITSRTTTINADSKKTPSAIQILGMDINTAFASVSSAENASDFLNEQIISMTHLLEDKAAGKPINYTYSELAGAIEKCAQTKELISANVNPAFALASLVLSLNLNTKSTKNSFK